LYCKGADSFILKALSPTLNDREIMKGVEDSLMFYSKAGLRTLCLARKELPAALFEQWLDEYQTLKML
jgi:magnesium-transporting ATPase (P-type)